MDIDESGAVQAAAYLKEKSETQGQTVSSHTGTSMQNIVDQFNFLYSNNHSFKIFRGFIMGSWVQISIPVEHS